MSTLPEWSSFLQVRNVNRIEHSLTRSVESSHATLQNNVPTFFVIDVLYNDAFGHWQAESAVFLRYWIELNQHFPELYLLLDKDRIYKRLVLKAYDISQDRIVFGGDSSLPVENLCIFPPLVLLNDPMIDLRLFSALWSSHILYLQQKAAVRPDKRIGLLALPRQLRENYKPNDRFVPGTEEFCAKVLSLRCGYVLHTDKVTDFLEQVRLIASARVIVVDYGSSFFVNGSLAKNSLIIVVNGTLAPFPALEEECRWMESRGNCIVYVPTLADAVKVYMAQSPGDSHVFGDSHARFCFRDLPNSTNHAVNSVTMHRVGRDGLEAVNCMASGVKNGDVVFFVFGEIDCRCHIEKQVALGRDYNDIITGLVESYLDTIATNCAQFRSIYPVIVSVVPPVRYTDFLSANPPLSSDHGFPFVGSDQRRVQITRDLNSILKSACKSRGYDFLDIYHYYARTEDGTLKFELSDTICHIKDNSYILDKAIELMLTLR